MTNFDYVQKTIDIFEDSLKSGEPLTTTVSLAAKIGYSAHHLGRLFQSLCGEGLGRYMLARRLAEAAVAVRERSLSAREAAALFGWEDYSAFSRAVRKEFGTSPAGLRALDGGDLRLAARARPRVPRASGEPIEEPLLVMAEGFHATGLVFFMGANERGFHRPWRIFMANRRLINGVVGEDTWQFSSWDDRASDEDDGLWIHCAVKTDPAAPQDMRFFSRDVPTLRVLEFAHRGPIETIHDTYRRIFQEYLPASAFRLAGNMEFQRYGSGGEVTVCLPIIGG